MVWYGRYHNKSLSLIEKVKRSGSRGLTNDIDVVFGYLGGEAKVNLASTYSEAYINEERSRLAQYAQKRQSPGFGTGARQRANSGRALMLFADIKSKRNSKNGQDPLIFLAPAKGYDDGTR